jgi:hypothetical protein
VIKLNEVVSVLKHDAMETGGEAPRIPYLVTGRGWSAVVRHYTDYNLHHENKILELGGALPCDHFQPWCTNVLIYFKLQAY